MEVFFVDFEMCVVQKKAAPKHMHFEIIQFGAVAMDENFNFTDEFNRFVKPQYGELTPEITQLTGITENMLENQATFIKAFSEFIKWIGDDSHIIYSWSANDLLQLKNEACIKGFPTRDLNMFANWIDFQRVFTEAARLSHVPALGYALELMQLEFVGSKHFADADAYNTARLFRLCSKLKYFDMDLTRDNEADANRTASEKLGENMSADELKKLLGF